MPYSRNQLALIAAGFCLDCEKTELRHNSEFRRCFKCRYKKSKTLADIKAANKKQYDRKRYLKRKKKQYDRARYLRRKGGTNNGRTEQRTSHSASNIANDRQN